MQVSTGTATLAVGNHDVRVHWFEGGGGAGAIVHYKGPDIPSTTRHLCYLQAGLANPDSQLPEAVLVPHGTCGWQHHRLALDDCEHRDTGHQVQSDAQHGTLTYHQSLQLRELRKRSGQRLHDREHIQVEKRQRGQPTHAFRQRHKIGAIAPLQHQARQQAECPKPIWQASR